MSKLGKLLGSTEEIKIQGEKFTIVPLKVKDLKDFKDMTDATDEEKYNFGKDLIKKCLKDSKENFQQMMKLKLLLLQT